MLKFTKSITYPTWSSRFHHNVSGTRIFATIAESEEQMREPRKFHNKPNKLPTLLTAKCKDSAYFLISPKRCAATNLRCKRRENAKARDRRERKRKKEESEPVATGTDGHVPRSGTATSSVDGSPKRSAVLHVGHTAGHPHAQCSSPQKASAETNYTKTKQNLNKKRRRLAENRWASAQQGLPSSFALSS